MISRVDIAGWRNVRADGLELAPVNLLIGPNNSGKSNFLRAVAFGQRLAAPEVRSLSALTESSFITALRTEGAIEVARRTPGWPRTVQLGWEVRDATGSATYRLGWETTQGGFPTNTRIVVDEVSADGVTTPRPTGLPDHHLRLEDGNPLAKWLNTSLQPALLEAAPTLARVRAVLERIRSYSATTLSIPEIVEGSPTDLGVRQLDPVGAQFHNVFRYLDDQYDFADTLREVLLRPLPWLRRIKLVDFSEQRRLVRLVHKDGPAEGLPMRDLSDGSIRLLTLALLLHSPERYGVLCFDEPELNLHPAWLRVVADWIGARRSADQLFISTHSPDLLDAFTGAFQEGSVAVLVFGSEGVVRRRPDDIAPLLQEGWELGDLYRVGEPLLGGWPG